MKNIKSIDSKEYEYFKLFRSQISRYEIALGLLNAVSKKTSKEMIDILKYFKIFDEIYYDDLAFFKEKAKKDNKSLLDTIIRKGAKQ